MRAITGLANVVRGRDYYCKYKKMCKRDLREISSFNLISNLAHGKILDVGLEARAW
jgi:hypothetical protein